MDLVCVDIGGTKCMVGTAREIGVGKIEIVKKLRFDTDAATPERSMDRIVDEVGKLIRENSNSKIGAIGVSVGGYVDIPAGVIVSTPVLPGLKNYPIGKTLQDNFGIEAHVQNDANACALAEWLYGAGMGSQNMAFLTCGTGLGAGFILDGKLYTGASSYAGEVGHIRLEKIGPVGCGKAGSFEGLCSGAGIAQYAQMRALEALQSSRPFAFAETVEEIRNITTKSLAYAADSGDKDAVEIFNQAGLNLGRGLAIILDILNPEIIVLGSVFRRCRHLLENSMNQSLREESMAISFNACKILPSKLGDDIGLFAAAATAIAAIKGKVK